MLSSSPVLKSRTHLELTCREDKLSIVITAEELKGTSIEAEAVVVTIVLPLHNRGVSHGKGFHFDPVPCESCP